jgi:NAD(P)-dependent dehydrogenase (short-subunit alcohol dehydrogenase family)
MKFLQGHVALVTGASRGIGKGTAIALAKEGVKVYITGRTIEENKAPQTFRVQFTRLRKRLKITTAPVSPFNATIPMTKRQKA